MIGKEGSEIIRFGLQWLTRSGRRSFREAREFGCAQWSNITILPCGLHGGFRTTLTNIGSHQNLDREILPSSGSSFCESGAHAPPPALGSDCLIHSHHSWKGKTDVIALMVKSIMRRARPAAAGAGEGGQASHFSSFSLQANTGKSPLIYLFYL